MQIQIKIHTVYTAPLMMCRIVGGARAVDGQAECLEGQTVADVFGLKSGVTTEGSCSLVLYYDHMHGITRNTQLLYNATLLLLAT